MNTILTDDEMIAAVGAPAFLAGGRAVEAAVLAKLERQEPVAWMLEQCQAVEFEKQEYHGQAEWTPLYTHPAPQQADRQRVRDEPDWRHPKIQALIGADARSRICIDLVWRILENPRGEFTASDMEYWDKLHDKVQEVALAAAPEAPAQAAPSADEVERGDVVAFEFYNRATGHAIVDYSVNTHVGNLSADKGYEARPLVYADKREEVTDGSKPIPLWQAREALDELEAAARGDEPFNHFAAGLVRSALEQAAPEAPAQEKSNG